MSAVERIEQHIKLPVPPEFRALYKRADGERDPQQDGNLPSSDGRPKRLMSASEVVETFETYKQFKLRDSVGFWKGWNGTYAFVYIAGPLKGRVYFWDYDLRHTSVAYRSISTFLEAMNDAGKQKLDWYEMPIDDHHYAFNIMALTPPGRTVEIERFLESKDMWIQERACELLGHRKYEPSVEKLASIAKAGTANGRIAAHRALQRIDSALARQRLHELKQ